MKNELIKRIISSLILLPLALFLVIKGSIFFNFFLITCFLIISIEWHNMTKHKSYNIYGFVFLLISFYTIYQLRNEFEGEYFYILLITIVCIFTDIGGYLFGKLLKGPKLTNLSPNKTYTGVAGSFLLPILFFVFFSKYENTFFNLINLNLDLYIFIILISLISQAGDILISYFKRMSKIKDTGKIIPGHGGLLDRLDGMIFAFPFGYILLTTNLIYQGV